MSSLHTAILNDRIHQIRMLLTVGIKVDTKDAQGRTPLMVACFMTNKKRRQIVCDLLLVHGANVNLIDKFKRTVLMYACATRNTFLLRELTEYVETDLNKTDKDGNTCLMYAAIEGDVEVMKLILRPFEMYGITLDVRNQRGFTAYLLALKNGNVECAQLLQNKGASTNIFDSENHWGGKEWLASHYKNRLHRESLQSGHHVRSKSENLQRREDSHSHGLLQRPRSMPPLLDYSNNQETHNSQVRCQSKFSRRSKPSSAASSLGTRSVDHRSRESETQMAAKTLKSPRPGTGSSVSKTVPRPRMAWNNEKEVDTFAEDQEKEIGDYDVILRPLTGCSFRSEAIIIDGKSDFGDSVLISTHDKRRKNYQQEQLVKLFEQYSLNQVQLPRAKPKQQKIEIDVKQRPLKGPEMQKREATFQRKRRMSISANATKLSDKFRMRALGALSAFKKSSEGIN